MTLYEQNYNRIERLMSINHIVDEDWRQYIRIKLWKTLEIYDPSKGMSLDTYIYTNFKYAVFDLYRDNLNEYKFKSDYKLINLNSKTTDCNDELNEVIPDVHLNCINKFIDDDSYKSEMNRLVKTLFKTNKKVHKLDKTIFDLYHNDDYTFQEIGDMMGVTRQSVSYRYHRFQKQLAKCYLQMGDKLLNNNMLEKYQEV